MKYGIIIASMKSDLLVKTSLWESERIELVPLSIETVRDLFEDGPAIEYVIYGWLAMHYYKPGSLNLKGDYNIMPNLYLFNIWKRLHLHNKYCSSALGIYREG